MKEEIHAGNCGSGKVFLLSVNLAVGQLVIVHVSNSLDEHASRATGWIIDGFSGFWSHQHDQQLYNGTRRVELARILLRKVCEFLNQEFIAIAHHVGRVVSVTDLDFGHVFNQVLQAFIGELGFIGPVGIVEAAEYTAKGIRVSTFNTVHGIDDSDTDILAGLTDILPVTAFRNNKTVVFRETGVFFIAAGFFERCLGFLIVNVGQAFEEEDRRYVALVLVLIDRATQNIAGFKQVREELLACCFFGMRNAGFKFHVGDIHSRLHHFCTTSCLYFFSGRGFYTNTTGFLNFLEFGWIFIFKLQQNFQETLIQEGESVFSYTRRYTIIGFCNGSSDGCKSIAVAADGDCITDSVFETGGFEECFKGLWYCVLAGFVELVSVTDGIQSKINRIVMLHDIILNFHQAAASLCHIYCNSSSLSAFDAFRVIVGYFGNSF